MTCCGKKLLLGVIRAFIVSVLFYAHAGAGESGNLQLDLDQHVIYCAVEWQGDRKSLTQALQSGITVTFVWRVQVEQVREYWANKTIADIQLSRRVLPDLLSRKWVLEDDASGISRRVASLNEAIRFLTRLEQFPILDRSLLADATPYNISVNVAELEGEINDAWWATLWQSVQFSTEKDFLLP